MASESMETDDSVCEKVKNHNEKALEILDSASKQEEKRFNGNESHVWSESNVENEKGSDEKDGVFTFIQNNNHSVTSQDWEIRSPQAIKFPFSYPSHTYVRRRPSHENGAKSKKPVNGSDKTQSAADSRRSLIFSSKSPSSAFRRNYPLQSLNEVQPNDREINILKRCNSAPILNDYEVEEMSTSWVASHVASTRTGRIRRFSATVVSLNASPASGSRPSSRLRLHQLKKEESLEGIQNKETEHEREVQATIQISSNCSDMSLGEPRRSSLDGYIAQNYSPKNRLSPSSSYPQNKPHFPVPSTAGAKSTHSRAIDFSAPYIAGSLSPTTSLHQHVSSGIPSPLTFSPSPSLYSSSPLPPSPTRSLCGPGKQCFSPSMQVPVSFARATSRSPSPSPTRRGFVTRRRSQSPCIMRPSALGAIKRKCDSDNESSSPKRPFAPTQGHNPPQTGVTTPEPNPTVNSTFPQRLLVHRSHSLSSSSIDSSDASVTPSPPYHAFAGFHPHHNPSPLGRITRPHHIPIVHSSTPGGGPVHLHHPDPSSLRPSSPASSTCSSSSLEGIRDLQPLTSPCQGRNLKKPPVVSEASKVNDSAPM